MSNPTELPDLLPCAFCGATDPFMSHGPWLGKHVKCGEPSCSVSGPSAPTEALAAERWNRRAQPEGEAPQADAMMVSRKLLADCLKSMNHAVAYGETRQGRPPSQTCMFEIEALTALLGTSAATLSPLCGAQHAESGALDWPHAPGRDGAQDAPSAPGTPEAPKGGA